MNAIKTIVLVILLLIPAIHVHAIPLQSESTTGTSEELIHPQTDPECPYEVLSYDANQITLKANGETFTIESSFSMPNSTWQTRPGSNVYFNHTRKVEQRKGYIHITDTFVNISGNDLPVLQKHSCNLEGRMQKAWIAGRTMTYGGLGQSENPTSYAITDKTGIGLMPVSDEMLVHVRNQIYNQVLSLTDYDCVIPQESTYSAEWVIVPTQRPDFWDFVNACRRIRDVNFTLNHMFAFLHPGGSWGDNRVIEFIRNKSANVVAAGTMLYNGYWAHGTAWKKLNLSLYANHNDRIRRLLPDVKPIVYFHCYLDSGDPAELTLYYNDRTLLSDGSQGLYAGDEHAHIFFVTDENEWGKAMVKTVDSILGFNEGDCKANGVYWDGMSSASELTKYHYGNPWDRISGDIDSRYQLIRYKSSTLLLGRKWIVNQINRIMMQGTLFTNQPPHIRSLYELRFQSFAEVWGNDSYLAAILSSPVGLGNRRTDTSLVDAYRGMINALNYGCLYNWYGGEVEPEHQTLTKYMFPITPIELHEGYIIGNERIVTNRSGSFGWGDDSVHEVHVFNDKGREVPCVSTQIKRTKNVDGKIYTELQLSLDWSAAIIRHPNGWKGPIGYCPSSPWLNLLLGN